MRQYEINLYSKYMLYILLFFIFAFIGNLYEYTSKGKLQIDGISKKLFDINLPILPIYGVCGIVLYLIHKYFNYSMLYKVILSFFVINIIECIGGQLSYKFHNYQTWRYDNYSLCSGYISLRTSVIWTIMSFVVLKIFSYYD